MKKYISFLIIMTTLLTGCSSLPYHPYSEWETEDKILFGTNIGLNLVDIGQTSECVKLTGCIEANPVLARKDGKPDMLRVSLFKGAILAGQYYALSHRPIDSKSKTIALGIGTVILTAVIVSNALNLRRSGYSGLAALLPLINW